MRSRRDDDDPPVPAAPPPDGAAPSLREAIQERLLGQKSDMPTSAIGRFGRTALGLVRGARLLGKRQDAAAPDIAALVSLVGGLGQLKGLAMKVGQMMSFVDGDLPEELRSALAALQTHSAPMPFERVREIVTADLGARAPALLATMDPVPVAAASIGQVHRARVAGAPVAVKVRYPDIEKAIASDFRPAAIGTRFASLFYPGANVEAMVREARERFLGECDYQREAASQARFGALFAGHPILTVPSVYFDLSARRVLTTAWAEGRHFEAFLATDPPQAERDRLGMALFEFYLGTLFRHRLYNCDPHPGNYVFATGGRLVMLDYGCTREFEPSFLARLAELRRAVDSDDEGELHRAFVGLGLVREGRAYDFPTARAMMRSFFGPTLRDEVRAIDAGDVKPPANLVASKRQLMKLTIPGEMLFLFRIRYGLMSILARLGARANWHRLERGYLEESQST